MGKELRKQEPVDIAKDIQSNGDPVTMGLFRTSAPAVAPKQDIPSSPLSHYSFNPNSPEFEFIDDPTPATTNTDYFNSKRQPITSKIGRAVSQFGVNAASSFGQGLANTFDLLSFGKTVKGELTGSDDSFDSSLFGLTTREMQDWANKKAEDNRIFEENPGEFNLGDMGWWANQFASAGTGVGMAVEALASTALIEAGTGGTGTVAALGKLGNLWNRITKGKKGLETMQEAVSVAKGLRSAATVYGAISRYSEGRMEASQNYDEIFAELSQEKNQDGTDKFSDEEKHYIASEGARRTFNLNLALMPLDIIGYRTMVFNPISGSATGLVERGLNKIGNKWLRSGVKGTVFSATEGIEEGAQFIAQQEGNHYARVLGGLESESSLLSRVGNDVQQDEFWNNFAGGVIGSPIIGGTMKIANKMMAKGNHNKINSIHEDYIKNIAKMDHTLAAEIKKAEENGDMKTASVLRRQFGANKALSALHLDAMTDKNTAFDSYKTFVTATLEELNNNKTDSLADLGFNVSDPEQLTEIKNEFQQYLKDADMMSSIYNDVRDKYNKNFVPEITHSQFVLNTLLEERGKSNPTDSIGAVNKAQFDLLSADGKRIYNTEYKLEALTIEEMRLNQEKKNATPEEAEMIEKELANIVKKKNAVSESLSELTPTEEDNAILQSALKDPNYLTSVYEAERLDSAISMQRMRVAKWNDPSYINERTKKAAISARTETQRKNNEDAVANDPKAPEDLKDALKEKQEEIAAKQAAEVVKAQEQAKAEATVGNSTLFSEDETYIDAIRQDSLDPNTNLEAEPTVPDGDSPIFFMAPKKIDFNKSSEDAKIRVANSVMGLMERVEDKSFEGLVRHIIKVKGSAVADEIFEALKYGWEATGREKVDYDAIYNKIFGNPVEDLLGAFGDLTFQTEEKFEEATDKVEEEVGKKEEGPKGFTEEGQPVYEYTGYVTDETSPKMAFVSRLNIATTQETEDTIQVSRQYTSQELNAGGYVDSMPLLDPDSFTEGTPLTIKVPTNFNDILVPVYNEDGTKGKAIPFGQYVAERNLKPEDQEYRDKIPMIIYPASNTQDKGVAFVHDVGWYNVLSFNQNKPGELQQAIDNTRRVRESVLTGQNMTAPAVVTSKRQTTFAGLKTGGELITLNEANPETQIVVARDSNNLFVGRRELLFEGTDNELVNTEPFRKGQILEVRRYGKKDGKKTFIAFPVFREKISKEVRFTVIQAIYIYANRKNQANPTMRDKHDAVSKQVLDTMGLDIKSAEGLQAYLKHFITVFNPDKAKDNSDVERQAKELLAPGTPYIAFIQGGNIVIGRADQDMGLTPAGKKVTSFFINPNMSAPNLAGLTAFNNDSMLGWFEDNADLTALQNNKPVAIINPDATVSTVANSYKEYLRGKFKTNIRSHNIGTATEPNYVTNIQPIITYDVTSAVSESEQTKQEVAAIAEVKTEESLPNELDDILRQAEKDLGMNFGKSPDELYSPVTLSEASRNAIAGSINRIAGLTPGEQYDIVDFIYNQIVIKIDMDGQQVSKELVDSSVEEAFNNFIEPRRLNFIAKIENFKGLLQSKPEMTQLSDLIALYEHEVGKMDAVKKGFNELKQEAYLKVAKYTGITQTEAEVEEDLDRTDDPDADTTNEDQANKKEKDFWTDVLTENPTNKLTYSLRRFFGQVLNVERDGKPIKGFLGLPTYVGSDTVTRTLMTLLADVPADFDIMMAKLESHKDAIGWMQSLIDKMNTASQDKKNLFVTVMANTSLKMKFTMISFNKANNSWTTKVYDTNTNGLVDSIKRMWRASFYDTDLAIVDEEGNYTFNKKKAAYLISKFNQWTGVGLPVIPTEIMNPLWDTYISRVKKDKPITFTPVVPELISFLKENASKVGDKVKFSVKAKDLQIVNIGPNLYQIGLFENSYASKEEVGSWLSEFGIKLSPETLDELLTKGMRHNYVNVSPADLFQVGADTNGLFGILYKSLVNLSSKEVHNFTEYGDSPLDNSVIGSLANIEAKYNISETPFGFRDNGKSFFAFTAGKFITDRARDLKQQNSTVLQQLEATPFSSPSLWLTMLKDNNFKSQFQVSHVGANAFKQLGKKLYKDNSLVKLSDMDHELTKLGMFWDTTQGDVAVNYPGTGVKMRMATTFSPTMSDKQIMTLVTTAMLDIRNKDVNNNNISNELAKVMYEQIVKPELKRMISFHQLGGKTNIAGYDKGASMFMFLPELNNLEYVPGLKLTAAIKNEPFLFTEQFVEGNKDLMESIYGSIKNYVNELVKEKKEVWTNMGFVQSSLDASGKTYTNLKYFDKKYLDRLTGTNEEKLQIAAIDYVVNNMVATANSYMLFSGDPAFYYKSKEKTVDIIKVKDSFINAGKRLANQIAPGLSLANSEKEKYIQVFLDDRKSQASNIEYLKEILGETEAEAYRSLNGSDAQEYTTWSEHLDILARMGKTGEDLFDITAEEIGEARKMFTSDIAKSDLTDRQKQILGKVMQPIKPVYTGQIFDPEQKVMRTVYIKSSSFPLIPQLTAGMEIDKLRLKLEALERKTGNKVRASYQSANKVGAVTNPVKIWNEDGRINEEALKGIDVPLNGELSTSALLLDRKNFRIQQEVPFKSGKLGEDKITLGTQLMKLIFGDEIMNFSGFSLDGVSKTGLELYREYNQSFIDLVNEKKKQLFTELGLDQYGRPTEKTSNEKLQALLRDEAIKRNYPLQDIDALTLNENGEFELPLWASVNSNRYESMLNSIVTNRVVRQKMPGASYVVGSEEGFKTLADLTDIEKSSIIWTSAWNGQELQARTATNKAQVLVPSKFKNADGELVNLFDKQNGEYKYITKTEKGWLLKEDMFDSELLQLTSFRIPTSGLQSASQIEIAGFLPFESGDLMIVPKNFTKQKGLDFDIDKENTYQLWNFMTEDGKFQVLDESHRDKILSQADKVWQAIKRGETPENKMILALFGDEIKYTKEDIESNDVLAKINSKINEKLLQNKIIKIKRAILGSDNKQVQAKINKTLNTDYAEEQAEFIDELINIDKDETYWTALSDEYQKSKVFLGASGKIGTGAYSLDVVFHSLVSQLNTLGKPIQLTQVVSDEKGDPVLIPKTWTFGNIESSSLLGNNITMDGDRSIAEVLSERQNIAVDNEKLQVMGRVGLNDITLDVDKVMTLVGLDKGTDGNSIAFLFLSQPIIKDYVTAMKNAGSTVAEFSKDKEATIVTELLKKYVGVPTEVGVNYWELASKSMTNENFINAIRADKPDGKLQEAVLYRFLEMRDYGLKIRQLQTSINVDSKGLGKSFFDVVQKREAINKLGTDTDFISGASNLIGVYEPKGDYSAEELNSLISEGYVDMGQYMIKPTTLSGAFAVNGVSMAYGMWSKYFPYDSIVVNRLYEELSSIVANDDAGDSRAVKLKQDIFKHLKKYMNTYTGNGIVDMSDKVFEERKRLYIDSEENTSLAKYVKTLKEMSGNRVVDTFIKNNKLFNRFEFDIKKDGQPSLIKYNNAAGEEFDEQYLYESLASMMEVRGEGGRIVLPTVGNKTYTLDSLAQDLIAYTMLGNSTQEAIQFAKYIPVSYLTQVGYSDTMRNYDRMFSNFVGFPGMRNMEQYLVSDFTMQYVQHHPEKVVYKMSVGDKNKNTIKLDDNSFLLKTDDTPTFISVYDNTIAKGEKKFQLYWYDGMKYNRIPVLGVFGMDEYDMSNDIATSLVNSKQMIGITPTIKGAMHTRNTGGQPLFEADRENMLLTMTRISESKNVYAPLAKALLPFIPADMKLNVVELANFRGRYESISNRIEIAADILSSEQDLTETVIHEFIHYLTVNSINNYITSDPSGEVSVELNAPAYVEDLVVVYNNYRKTLDKTEIIKMIYEVRNGVPITQDRLDKYYPATNIYEFLAAVMTNRGFQRELNKIPYKKDGKTLFEKFKEAIQKMFEYLGLKFDEGYSAAQAVSDTFKLIDENNPKNNFGDNHSEGLNLDDNPIGTLMPSLRFPEYNIVVPNTECK